MPGRAALARGSLLVALVVFGLLAQRNRPVSIQDSAIQLQRAARTVPPLHGRNECQPEDEQPLGALVRPSEESDIVYELKPDLDTCFQETRVRTNHQGFRASWEYATEKPAGTLRILGLGDSLMFGWGMPYEATYASTVERVLSKRLSRPVEFINTAVPGYNTAIEAAVLEKRGLRYTPDVVIVHWCGNDFGVPQFLQKQALAPLPNPVDTHGHARGT